MRVDEPIRDVAAYRVRDEIGLDEAELAARLAYLELTDDDLARLRAERDVLHGLRDAMIGEFYDFLYSFPQTSARLPQDPEGKAELRRTRRAYFDALVEGRIDRAYVESRLRIGLIHYRMGVEPKWYIGAYRKYLACLIRWLPREIGTGERFILVLDALLKMVLFDMEIALEAYHYEDRRALDEAHAYAAQIVATRPLGIVVLDERLAIESANRAFCNLFGVLPEDLVGLELADDLVPVPGLARLAAQVRDEGLAVRDWLLRAETGAGPRHFEVSIEKLRYHGASRLMVALNEATQRVAAQESQSRLRQAVDTIDEAVFLVDVRTLRFVDVNASACGLLGYTREELLMLGPRDIHPALGDEERRKRYERVVRGETESYPGEAAWRRKDGSEVRVALKVSASRWLGKDFMVVVAREPDGRGQGGAHELDALLAAVAHGTRLDNVLSRIAAFLESACRDAHCAILATGAEGPQVGLLAAPSLPEDYRRRMVGLALGPETGTCGWALYGMKPVISLEGPEDPLWRGNPGLAALEQVRACWSVPILNGSGRALGVIELYLPEARAPSESEWAAIRRCGSLAEMAIERWRLQQETAAARAELGSRIAERTRELEAANRELESFSYSLSHDLRAPLRAIAGFSTLLAREHAEAMPAEARHYLERIAASSERVGALIGDMLKLFRLGREELRPREIDLSALARQLAEELRAREPARNVVWKIEPGIRAFADPGLMRIVLANLFDNAWKYSAPRDPAEIALEPRGSGPHETVVCVQDNGVGFDMAFAPKLFGLCQRLHSEKEFPGNGLGLAIVRRVIERHGGRVWASAARDKGAAFCFALPRRGA